MSEQAAKVFISYSWDSEEHKDNVLSLANTLRKPWGIETDLDQYVRAKYPYTPEKGWDIWMEKRIEWAEFVLIVCTETYKRRFRGDEEPGIGKGVTWEGTIIRQELYNAQLKNTKFIPIVFSSKDLIHVPIILNGNDKYVLEDEKSFRELCYRLRKEPTVAMPEVATAKLQAPPEPKFFSPQKPQAEPPPVLLDVAEIQDPNATQREAEEKAERERIQREQQLEDVRSRQADQPVSMNDLASDRGVDYTQLRDLLEAGKWQEADQETAKRMCEVMGRQQEDWLRIEDIKTFSCTDLHTINQLWTQYSNGRFGFSIQKQIWMEVRKSDKKFGEQVGWRIIKTIIRERVIPGVPGKLEEEEEQGGWLEPNQLTFSLDAPKGHLPWWGFCGFVVWWDSGVFSLASRLVDCNIP